MSTSSGTALTTENADLDPVWESLAQNYQDASSSDLAQSTLDHMDFEIPLDGQLNGFSPIFHELEDHDQFFTGHVVHNDKSLITEKGPNLDCFMPEGPSGPVGEIQEILLRSGMPTLCIFTSHVNRAKPTDGNEAGLSAIQPTVEMFGIEPQATDHPTPTSVCEQNQSFVSVLTYKRGHGRK